MKKTVGSLAIMTLVAGGCGETRFTPREDTSAAVSSYVMAVQPTTQPAVPPAAQLVRPMRLAVAQVGEVAPPASLTSQLAARSDLFAAVDALPAVSAGAPNISPQDEVKRIMGNARQLGDNYLFILGGTIDQTDTVDPLSVLDLTIVGCFLVPSHHIAAQGRVSGALIDLRTERVVSIVTSEAVSSTITTTANTGGAGNVQSLALRDELAGKLGVAFVEKLDGKRW